METRPANEYDRCVTCCVTPGAFRLGQVLQKVFHFQVRPVSMDAVWNLMSLKDGGWCAVGNISWNVRTITGVAFGECLCTLRECC